MKLIATVFIALLSSLSLVNAAATKIMALGDSITGSPVRILPSELIVSIHRLEHLQGCWRALLWQSLTNAGKTNIDFVGTLAGQGCGFTYDGENEGHGGYLATNIASQNLLPGWLSSTLPDIVIMHCRSSVSSCSFVTAC
jgi:hypothetical protein